MIKGLGLDMVQIARMEKMVQKEHFLKRVFTEKELEYCNGFPARLAGNFAVKEAVAKAFGTGFRGFEPHDIEVLRDALGCPYINLGEKAEAVKERKQIQTLHVSITNEADYACAVVVAEGE